MITRFPALTSSAAATRPARPAPTTMAAVVASFSGIALTPSSYGSWLDAIGTGLDELGWSRRARSALCRSDVVGVGRACRDQASLSSSIGEPRPDLEQRIHAERDQLPHRERRLGSFHTRHGEHLAVDAEEILGIRRHHAHEEIRASAQAIAL